MPRFLTSLALVAALTVQTGCGGDEAPSAADARIAEANARTAAAEARIAELEAAGMPTEAPDDETPPPTPSSTTDDVSSPQPTSSSTSFSVPARSGDYTGQFNLSGVKTLCHTYAKTDVSSFSGMELCYEVDLQQAADGRLSGSGQKISEETTAVGFRQLPPSEQTRILVNGYIADGETVHLEYTVQGARRSTRGVAQYASANSPTPNYNMVGTFRTDAAGASGPARLDF
ncbi:MAG: hypothetical protein AAFQ43_05440 [Bacteroidota bacterium]